MKGREGRNVRSVEGGKQNGIPDCDEGEEAVHPVSEVHFWAPSAEGVRRDVHFRVCKYLEVNAVPTWTGVMQGPARH